MQTLSERDIHIAEITIEVAMQTKDNSNRSRAEFRHNLLEMIEYLVEIIPHDSEDIDEIIAEYLTSNHL